MTSNDESKSLMMKTGQNNAIWKLILSNSVSILFLFGSSGFVLAEDVQAKQKSASAGSKSQVENKVKEGKNGTSVAKPKASTSVLKPKVLSWQSFAASDEDDERSYNLFKYKATAPSVDATDPSNWRAFNPSLFANKTKLVPNPSLLSGLGLEKYNSPEIMVPQDPTKTGASTNSGKTVVFAHQGTPLSNGWLAPKAGYAYQLNETLVYGTTNYTPINYNGEMSKYIGVSRVPVEILSSSGSKELLDMSRLVFAVNDDLLSKPHNKVYPSIIYLKQGEKALIQGYGPVSCPPQDSPEQVIVQTLNGDQSIKVLRTPDNPVIPGKVTP